MLTFRFIVMRTSFLKPLRSLPLLFCLFLMLSSCSTKKNTPVSRQWHAFNTRYNVYFNGKTHFDEQLFLTVAKFTRGLMALVSDI